MATPHKPEDPDETGDETGDEALDAARPLDPGEIVTVIYDQGPHEDTRRDQAFVIIDSFWHDRIATAALGGDGLEWRNQPRERLRPVLPARLRQTHDADGVIIHVVD